MVCPSSRNPFMKPSWSIDIDPITENASHRFPRKLVGL
jgi:hypothetical protein